jgi:hypothetical protein
MSTNGLLLLALVTPEVIYSGNLSVNWSDMTQVIESPLGHILSITALPGVVVDYPQADSRTQVPTVHVVIVGESRCMMVALSAHKNPVPGQPQADLARVVWSDVRRSFLETAKRRTSVSWFDRLVLLNISLSYFCCRILAHVVRF